MDAKEYYQKLIKCINKTSKLSITRAINEISNAVENNKWVFTCGNGGSSSTASHYVTDWAKMRFINKSKSFKAMCLSDNIGIITAYGNDLSYENTFDYSLKNYASDGDVIVIVSSSGNSKNLINVALAAKKLGVKSIGVVGFNGGKLAEICDFLVHYPVSDTQICEDLHLSFGHLVMKKLCQ